MKGNSLNQGRDKARSIIVLASIIPPWKSGRPKYCKNHFIKIVCKQTGFALKIIQFEA